MGIIALIGIAGMLEEFKDMSVGSFTAKPIIGAGILAIILTAIADGFSKRLAYIVAWLVLLGAVYRAGPTFAGAKKL